MKNAVGREIPDALLAGGREVYQGRNYMDGKYIRKASPAGMRSPRRARSWTPWRRPSGTAGRRVA